MQSHIWTIDAADIGLGHSANWHRSWSDGWTLVGVSEIVQIGFTDQTIPGVPSGTCLTASVEIDISPSAATTFADEARWW